MELVTPEFIQALHHDDYSEHELKVVLLLNRSTATHDLDRNKTIIIIENVCMHYFLREYLVKNWTPTESVFNGFWHFSFFLLLCSLIISRRQVEFFQLSISTRRNTNYLQPVQWISMYISKNASKQFFDDIDDKHAFIKPLVTKNVSSGIIWKNLAKY